MADTNYYSTLGIPRTADGQAIKQAYRKLAMKHHPDKNPNDTAAAELFQSIGQAYEILSDPEKRAVYDKYGEDGIRQMEGGGGPPTDPADIFQQMFGGAGGIGGMFRGMRTPHGRHTHQKATRAEATVDLKTVVCGGDIRVKFSDSTAKNLVTGATCTEFEVCSVCGGSGWVTRTRMIGPGMYQQSRGACSDCESRGFQLQSHVRDDCIWLEEVKELDVHFPAGHDLSEPLVLFEKGGVCFDPNTKKLKQCDLHVQIRYDDKGTGEWRLLSPRHRHLHWAPKLQVVYGLMTSRLKCAHPNGKQYILDMPTTQRTESFVAPGLGLPAAEDGGAPGGDLVVKVDWDFSTTSLAKLAWFAQMQAGLHARAPWTDPQQPITAPAVGECTYTKCLSADEYEQFQNTAPHRHHRSPRAQGAPQCKPEGHPEPHVVSEDERDRDQHARGHGQGMPQVQECVQS